MRERHLWVGVLLLLEGRYCGLQFDVCLGFCGVEEMVDFGSWGRARAPSSTEAGTSVISPQLSFPVHSLTLTPPHINMDLLQTVRKEGSRYVAIA